MASNEILLNVCPQKSPSHSLDDRRRWKYFNGFGAGKRLWIASCRATSLHHTTDIDVNSRSADF
ncbi:MAG: hypothetical protein NTW75_11165 [Planctomycetales bacterium]|jgi:hypothetical protein|nr:hypothetical protein [Planctomycetales bacterium]